VPDLHEYEDADQLIHAAVAKIAKYESRPERDVWRDIAEPMVDAQFFRTHPDAPSGSIPLPTGAKAVASILNLMQTAATTVERGPHLIFEGRRTQHVDAFLYRVMLCAAAPGSYVLAARVPVDPIGQQQLDFFEGSREFSGRTVVAQLHSALRAARTAAERVLTEHQELGTFYDAVEQGVSANLCKALGDLGGAKRDRPFEVGFSWARGLDGQGPAEEVKFTAAMPQVLFRAGEELTELARTGEARITGMVTDLHDQQGEPPRIKVAGLLQTPDGRGLNRRSVWVVLRTASDYEEGFRAQRRDKPVEAVGELTTAGSRLELHARSFSVLDGDVS
jgi:hypothetical protein